MNSLRRCEFLPPLLRNDASTVPAAQPGEALPELKDRLKTRLRQMDIWVTSHPLRVV
jgi:hypothetical protein